MPQGFLQGFYESEILSAPTHTLSTQVYRQALHLGMLGFPSATSILTLLHTHALPPPPPFQDVIHLFYNANNLPPPFPTADAEALERRALRRVLNYIPNSESYLDVTESSYSALLAYAQELESQNHAHTQTGYIALQLSATLTLLLYTSAKLSKSSVPSLLHKISSRINANRQADFFACLQVAWRWFVPGHLRDFLGLAESELEEYASFVYETVRRRLENGPVTPEDVYNGWGVKELLDELQKNTFSDPEFDPREFYFDEEAASAAPISIFHQPATEDAILAKETEIGRALPPDLREIFRICDGCEPVRTSPGSRATKFPPLEDIFLEDDEYMDDYGFTLLPDFDVQPKCPRGVSHMEWEYSFFVGLCEFGGIAVYEHDGQGTEYVWIIPKGTLDAARERVREVRAKVSDEQKERIDAEIVRRYGSREVYEGMEYCVYTQGFARPEGQEVYPDFMSYLRSVVFDSRVSIDRSPLKGGSE